MNLPRSNKAPKTARPGYVLVDQMPLTARATQGNYEGSRLIKTASKTRLDQVNENED